MEFQSRAARRLDPVLTMREYGTHQQPAGTWSDDASLSFCLAESLCCGYDLADLARRFVNWQEHNYWTPHGRVFDVGDTTWEAINRLEQGVSPLSSGGSQEFSNGNGSLMRILPLAFWCRALPMAAQYEVVQEVSSITHSHSRSVLACLIYVELAGQLLAGLGKHVAYQAMQQAVNEFAPTIPKLAMELHHFYRILELPYGTRNVKPLVQYPEDEISSSGYVVNTLEAALWCLLRYDTYVDTVLAAVNLGDDTDTTAAVTGGLAAIYYGEESIPPHWLHSLVSRLNIEDLARRLGNKLSTKEDEN